ncbi:hypothetical protein GCQ56_17245 [Marinifilum sp. N1E240]|uniref:response regulator transcription factor n=1 Tax=Marinifilum sp. N1E240 TaxID=2608082 RepID=UPI00128BC73A|nr:response regulator transcription factor [Marinifilum sp. N1E240]MPQ48754.1 hypothetical protein [Marinifilum sp. N1E240]
MPRISILIAENSCLIRKGLRSVLQKLENTEVIQTIDSKDELCEIVNKIKPEILIANPDMLQSDCEDLKQSFVNGNKLRLVLISDSPSTSEEYKADAHIFYKDTENRILDILQEIVGGIQKNKNDDKSNDTLSTREKNILKHIALGLTNKEIADQLFISIHTVVTHRKNITQKLSIKSVSGLTVYAILHNIISMDEVK